MYNLLVVEDEINVQRGICFIIKNYLPEWNIVDAVVDGESALTILKKEQIDLILTDIRIPGIDGLELIELVHDMYPSTLVAIISGYADFSYAQIALQNQVVDYLLKPTSPQSIVGVAQKAQKIINERNDLLKTANKNIRLDLIKYEKKLFSILKNNSTSDLRKNLHDFFNIFQSNESFSKSKLLALKNNLIVLLIDLCRDIKTNNYIIISENKLWEHIELLSNINDASEFINWQKHFIKYLKIEKNSFEKDNKSHIIFEAVNYINDNYSNEISLSTVAQHLFLSESYLSHIFKREMGSSFVEYLTHVRIEHAKDLLINNPHDKIYLIARSVGFSNERYFTTLFKKIVGITPADYRNSMLKQ